MRISFDLDDTLICSSEIVPREPKPSWFRRLFCSHEPMRLGTPKLISALRDREWEIWVYTTSFRSCGAIRRWMRSYGIKIDGVVNQRVHMRTMRTLLGRTPSKNPAAFGIELHVDDSEGVKMEGEELGFAVVVLRVDDTDWTEIVVAAADGVTKSCMRRRA